MEKRQRIERSKSVLSQFGCNVQAGRPGLNHGLCRHHRAQVEGVEGPMSEVPQVVTHKGGMPAPRARLQHLVDSKVLLKKKRRSNTTHLTSSGGGHGKCRSRARKRAISSSGARRRQWSSISPSCYALR